MKRTVMYSDDLRIPTFPFQSSRISALLCIGLLAGSLLGCGSNGPFDYVKVSGKVTYEDGSLIPVDQMTITFVPQMPPVDEIHHARSGITYTGSEGTFSAVTSYKANDGLVVGKHKVVISTGAAYSMGGPSKKKTTPAVPKEYSDSSTTPIEIDTADSPFHIKVKKP